MIGVTSFWKDDPYKRLNALKSSMKNKYMRKAMNKASAPPKATIISASPAQSGALKKSFRIRVRPYRNKEVWVSIIGPKSTFTRNLRRKGKKPILRRPSKYFPLLDKGTVHIRARNIVSGSMNTAEGQFAETLTQSLREQLATGN